MGGKIRVSTKTQIRLKKGKRLFKDIFPKDKVKNKDISVEFVGVVGTEEAIFRFKSRNNETYIVFYDNSLTRYADSLDYFQEEGEVK